MLFRSKPDMFDYINTGVSMQSILLCATRYGIGAQFLSILMDVPEGRVYMKSILDIPSGSNVEIIDSIRMGYIDHESRASFFDVSSDIRRPIERIMNKEKYGM